ncbi:MAG: histidinol-phosphatase HisJ family protein, partial [Clostridiales bacterium]|nr:histidinol-phosphatase HisJ family protein [Clostridiales bacterium]
HTHSSFSYDSSTKVDEMIEAAIKKGIKEIAITDHYDPDYPDPAFPFDLTFPEYHQKLLDVSDAYRGQIKVVKGIEIGIQHGETLIKCENAANAFPYDFILGSFHSAYNQDLYSQYFKDRSAEKGVYDFYLYVADCLTAYKNFDVLGHFNVIDRYVDKIPAYHPYMEIIEEILKDLIYHGKGLELNTSSFRYKMEGRTKPSKEILELYKTLGGEIITIGSDAHQTQHLGYRYDAAIEILKSYGFKYISTFENRKPDFVKI